MNVESISPDIHDSLINAAHVALVYMEAMVDLAAFPKGVARPKALEDIERVRLAIFEAEHPNDLDKVRALRNELVERDDVRIGVLEALDRVLDKATGTEG